MDSSSSSSESDYYSFPEDADDQKPQPLKPGILTTHDATTLHTESACVRLLTCLNAARVILRELSNTGTQLCVKKLKGASIIQVSIASLPMGEAEL